MTKHFIENGDEYQLSPAAVLLMVSDAFRAADTTPIGKERSLRIISRVMDVAREVRFEQADAVETALLFGGHPADLLAKCDAVAQHIGGWAVLAIARRVMAEAKKGNAHGKR